MANAKAVWDNQVMEVFKRLSPLWPGLPSFGWLVLGWTMLAHASTAQFTLSIAGHISKWLGENAWAGFVAGFALLAVTVLWPDIKKRLPDRWALPKTLPERMHNLEKHT